MAIAKNEEFATNRNKDGGQEFLLRSTYFQCLIVIAVLLSVIFVMTCTTCYVLKRKRQWRRRRRRAADKTSPYAVSFMYPNTQIGDDQDDCRNYENIGLRNINDHPTRVTEPKKNRKKKRTFFKLKKANLYAVSRFYVEAEPVDDGVYEEPGVDQYDHLRSQRRKVNNGQSNSHYGRVNVDQSGIYDMCRFGIEETNV